MTSYPITPLEQLPLLLLMRRKHVGCLSFQNAAETTSGIRPDNVGVVALSSEQPHLVGTVAV